MTYYDAEIEYLESTGTQYINTNIIGGSALTYDICVLVNAHSSGIIGSRNDTNRRTCWVIFDNNLRIQAGYGSSYKNSNNKYYQKWTTIRSYNSNSNHNVDINSDGVTEIVTVGNVQSFTNTQPVYLFGINNYGSLFSSFQCRGRVKYCKLYENETLVCDLVPVRVGQTGYLYDKVSDTLFGNAGTGSFILGPDVKVTAPIVGKPKVSSIRRQMIQLMPKHDYKYDDYIQDGLVFQLDGINKGNISTRWTDLVGGKYFTLNEHSIVHDDCIEMDGAGYISQNSTAVNSPGASSTIEVCLDGTNDIGCVYIPNSSAGISFMIYTYGYTYKPASTGNNQYRPGTKLGKFTGSFNHSHCLVNGSPITSKGADNWNANNSVSTIGGRNNGRAYYYTGKIYAIRIYNRQLTDAEMLYNQRIDNNRFKLNLGV